MERKETRGCFSLSPTLPPSLPAFLPSSLYLRWIKKEEETWTTREKEKGYPRSFDGGVRLPRRFGGESETTGNRSVLIWETAWTTRRSGLSCLLPLFSMASLFDGSTRSKRANKRRPRIQAKTFREKSSSRCWKSLKRPGIYTYGRISRGCQFFEKIVESLDGRWGERGVRKRGGRGGGRYLLTRAFVALVIRYRKRGKRSS